MKVLIDECLPKRLKFEIKADLVLTVPEAGWAGKKNGELLRLAAAEFDVLVTNDQNMEHQQVLKKFDLAFIVLVAYTNDIDDLRPIMPALNAALSTIRSGEITYLSANDK